MKTRAQRKQNDDRDERAKRLDELLKRQSELDVLRPVGSRKYKNWTEVNSKEFDYSGFPF